MVSVISVVVGALGLIGNGPDTLIGGNPGSNKYKKMFSEV